MKMITLLLPDDAAEWSSWLERQLVGSELYDLAGEMRIIAPPAKGPVPTLDDVLGKQRSAVLEHGLGVLRSAQIGQLLERPALLLRLQELILVEGGAYWQERLVSETDQETLDRQWQALAAATQENPAYRSSRANERGLVRRKWLGGLLALAALAACLLVAVKSWLPLSSGPTWGFDRSGLLSASMSSDEYFRTLADAAGDWFRKRPQTAAGLERRLREFRHGCDTLIAAPHPQLVPEDRQWLVARCQAWAGKIDAHLAELAADPGSVEDVRAAADATVRRLQAALQARAGETGQNRDRWGNGSRQESFARPASLTSADLAS